MYIRELTSWKIHKSFLLLLFDPIFKVLRNRKILNIIDVLQLKLNTVKLLK